MNASSLFDAFLLRMFCDEEERRTPHDESLDTDEEADEKFTCLLVSMVSCSSMRHDNKRTLFDLM